MTSASVKHCLSGEDLDDAGASGMEMQVTVSPFSVAFETTCTVGFSGDSTTLGDNAAASFINDFSGKLTGSLKVAASWGTLKGDLLVGCGGKGSLEGSSAACSAGASLLVDWLTGTTLAAWGVDLGFACVPSDALPCMLLPAFSVLSVEPVAAVEGGGCCACLQFRALILGDRLGGVAGGAICGKTCGDTVGDTFDDLFGDTFGDVFGETFGDTFGDTFEDTSEYAFGDLVGYLCINTCGETFGDECGDLCGDFCGDLCGDLFGDLRGVVKRRMSCGVVGCD